MENSNRTYDEIKQAIYSRSKERETLRNENLQTIEEDLLKNYKPGVQVSDVMQVGSKVLIGGGLGLLGGIAAIAVAASAGEIIIAGVVTKIAGVVGGAAGLSLGVHSYTKQKATK